jgi:phosphoenolpyruvate carboxykinase (GTP)
MASKHVSSSALSTNKHLLRWVEKMADLWPGCFYARSDARDVARVEDRTFICSLSKDNAGPPTTGKTPSRCAAS